MRKEKKGLVADLIIVITSALLVALAVPALAQPTADNVGIVDHIGDQGSYVVVPATFTNVRNGPVISLLFDVYYDSNVITVSGAQKGTLTSCWDNPSFNNFAWGTRVSLVYDGQTAHALQNGSTGSVTLLTMSVIGEPGETSSINLTNIQLADNGYNLGTVPAKNGTFTIRSKPDISLLNDTIEDVGWTGAYWDESGLWHLTTRRSNSTTHSWWYGREDTGTYDTGGSNSGALVSQTINLTDALNATLTYWTCWSTESSPNYDLKKVEVSVNGGAWTQLEKLPSGTGSGTRTVSLPVGNPIKIRFRFDTRDAKYNGYEGWFIDDIKIEKKNTTPSYTSGHTPTKNAINVSKNTSIVVHIKDDSEGVDQSTIVMTVEGAKVTPTITGNKNDYTLTYTPATPFSYDQVVDVTIDAKDLASPANTMPQDKYSFTIESAPGPGAVLNDTVEDTEWSESYWTEDGLWHITKRRSSSTSHSWWYGKEATGNYDTGGANSGSLVSQEINLADATNATLTYWTFWATEPSAKYDLKLVEVSVNGGAWTQLEKLPSGTGSGTRTISLPVGNPIKIRFRFDTVDKYYNTYEGWFIDDITVKKQAS